jgi:hypothetical protein
MPIGGHPDKINMMNLQGKIKVLSICFLTYINSSFGKRKMCNSPNILSKNKVPLERFPLP